MWAGGIQQQSNNEVTAQLEYSGADPGGIPRNPPFERASLTRDTLIEQSNRYTLIEQSQ